MASMRIDEATHKRMLNVLKEITELEDSTPYRLWRRGRDDRFFFQSVVASVVSDVRAPDDEDQGHQAG